MTAAYLAAVLITAASPTPRPSPHPTPHAGSIAPKPTETAGAFGALLGNQTALLVIGAVIAGYFLSLTLHPFSKCPRCKGKGVHRGSMYGYATRACTKCKGRGIQPRLGRRIFPYQN